MRAKAATRGGAATCAAQLALDDVAAARSKRGKADVCRPLCDVRCERAV